MLFSFWPLAKSLQEKFSQANEYKELVDTVRQYFLMKKYRGYKNPNQYSIMILWGCHISISFWKPN